MTAPQLELPIAGLVTPDHEPTATIQWAPIPGHDGYDVSSDGRVQSWWRCGKGSGTRRTEPVEKTVRIGSRGYPIVNLRTGGQDSHPFNVHTLMALAFIGPRPDGHDVCHINGERADNRVENIRYGTRQENILDSVAHGTHANAAKTHCKHNHPFSGDNLHVQANGRRVCKTCRKVAKDRWLAKRRGVETRELRAA